MGTVSRRLLLLIAFAWIMSSGRLALAQELFGEWDRPAEITATTGRNRVLIPAGTHGLNYFPDEVICILKEQPLTFTLVIGDSTHVLSGRSFENAEPVAQVLRPGPSGQPDNHYAGIGGIYDDTARQRVMGFYHAEDKEGIGIVEANGVQGFYGTICAAIASTDDTAFKKLGPAITADKPKLLRGWETEGGPKGAWMGQGVGEPTVCVDGTGKYLLCYFVEWSNRLKRGVQICVARCPIETAGVPGSWQKYHNRKFSEPGLGGHETPVISAEHQADTYTPHVQYVKEWERYVMVFGIGVGAEIHARPLKPVQSGLYVTTSKDGVDWTKPVQIEKVFAFVINTQECKIHPTLIVSRVTDDMLTGQLLYGYTPRWPDTPHHLGSCPITIKLRKQEQRDLKTVLAGTKWGNSNKVSFEWTNDGRFLHNGVERNWKVIDDERVQITLGPGHVDTLEFDDDIKTFRQLVKGGPTSFTGRRQSGSTTATTPTPSPSASPISVDALLKAAKSSKKNPKGEVVELDMSNVKLGDSEIAALGQIVSLQRLTAPQSGLSDDHISRLTNLTNLTSLGLWQTRVSNDGLKTIGKLTNLSYLSVEGNGRVTNDGVAHLSDCRKLSWLGLSYTGVSDDGMKHLTELPLTRIDLVNTGVGDNGLDHLAKISTLKTLTLTKTKATDAGVAKLKRSLPNCNVIR